MAVNRLTGLSGIDVDKMVKDLMKAESTKLDNLKAQKTKKQWEQDAYRDMTKTLSTFQSEYMDFLKPDTNFRSSSAFALFTTGVTNNGTASTKVTVSGSGGITDFSHSITEIKQLAAKDEYKSGQMDLAALTGKVFEDPATPFTTGMPTSFKMNLTIDKSTKAITLDTTGITTIEDFAVALNDKIKTAFGTGFENVATVDAVGTGKRLKLSMPTNTVKVMAQTGDTDSLPWIGIASGSTSADYASKTLASNFAFVDDDLKTMTVNGKSLYDMGIRSTDTINQMSLKFSAAGVGASFKYNSLTDQFQLTSNTEGEAGSITASASMLSGFGLSGTGSTHTSGKNAVLTLDGVEIVKSSNTFSVEGVTYSLKGLHSAADGSLDISLKVDTDKVADKIKTFVNIYNGLIKTVGSKLEEKVYRSFTPLTEDQKTDMSEDDIKLWEEKAKSGILRNQPDLSNMLNKMRTALSDAVEGAGMTLAEMGITTTSDYTQRGKLVITDESKLKSAIENNYSKVVSMFTASSDKAYQDASGESERYAENGLANRLNDILSDMVRTTKGNSNYKGVLLEKAGKVGDSSDITSTISKALSDYDTRIETMLEALTAKETAYYSKFSRLESALSQLNNQSSYLSQMLGG